MNTIVERDRLDAVELGDELLDLQETSGPIGHPGAVSVNVTCTSPPSISMS